MQVSSFILPFLHMARNHGAVCLYFACSKALELDRWNVRALYRRAEGLYNQGTTADLEKCVLDLQDALKLEPGNTQVGHFLTSDQDSAQREEDEPSGKILRLTFPFRPQP
jgi:hypothetical protein